jgi:hypothetical protein
MRVLLGLSVLFGLLFGGAGYAQEVKDAVLYKNPQCGCCEGYAQALRDAGYTVKVIPTHDLPLIKKEHKVPTELEGCHTTLIGNYVIEGHVPIAIVNRLMSERPDIAGISLPGMPLGSPGMFGDKTEPFTVFELVPGDPKVYAVE